MKKIEKMHSDSAYIFFVCPVFEVFAPDKEKKRHQHTPSCSPLSTISDKISVNHVTPLSHS